MNHHSTAGPIVPFFGYVETTGDALRLIQAARCGLIPRVTRRLNELERRAMIRSGAVFIFSVDESGIKRWTEGLQWSPSRIAGNFLVYREVTERAGGRGSVRSGHPDGLRVDTQGAIKPKGLTKKTITVKIQGSDHHLICYYTPEDVESGRLQRPTARSDIMTLEIPQELVQSTNFRYPPKIETSPDGKLTRICDSDEGAHLTDTSRSSSSPVDSGRMVPSGLVQSRGSPGSYAGSSMSTVEDLYSTAPVGSRRYDTTYAPGMPHSRSEPLPPLSTSIESQGMHSYYSPTSPNHMSPHRSHSDWDPSPYTMYDSPTDTSSPMSLSYSPEANHAYFHSNAMHNQSSWDQQGSMPSHIDGYSPLTTGHPLNAQDAGMSSSHSLAGQPSSSAPPMPSSLHLPTARRREHMRSRSGTSTWIMDHHGPAQAQYQAPSVNHSGMPRREDMGVVGDAKHRMLLHNSLYLHYGGLDPSTLFAGTLF